VNSFFPAQPIERITSSRNCSEQPSLTGLTENDGHEIDGHEIGGQDMYRLKIDYITMQCAILFKTMAEYKSQQRSKFYRPPVIVE